METATTAVDGGGWGDGTGVDGWCRVKPVGWFPLSFDYVIEPTPPFAGQHRPLTFEDPWWKVLLIIAAVLLKIAALVYDYVAAGQDPQFIIGKILRNGDANASAIDCAVASLNGSRGVDLGEEEAQGDDVNNGLPIEGLDSGIPRLITGARHTGRGPRYILAFHGGFDVLPPDASCSPVLPLHRAEFAVDHTDRPGRQLPCGQPNGMQSTRLMDIGQMDDLLRGAVQTGWLHVHMHDLAGLHVVDSVGHHAHGSPLLS
jgi:hypothetical protein